MESLPIKSNTKTVNKTIVCGLLCSYNVIQLLNLTNTTIISIRPQSYGQVVITYSTTVPIDY